MFDKLKNKLKDVVKKFSKEAEESVEEVEEIIEKEEEKAPQETKELEQKQEPLKKSKKEKKQEKVKKEPIVEKEQIPQETKVEEKSEKEQPKIEETIIKEEISEEPKEEKKGFFKKLKERVTTKTISENKFEDLFYDLELALIENNVAFEVVEKIKEDLKSSLIDKPLKGKIENIILGTLKNSLSEILSQDSFNLIEKIKSSTKPFKIVFLGQNGTGKTTSIAKVSHLLEKNNLSSVLVAADTFRAASIQQLEEWGNKLNKKVIKHDYNADPAAVAFDGIKYAQSHKIDVVLIDTAGRQHSNLNLMNELEKIIRVIQPDLKIFIGESITGNDCIDQATNFNNSIEIDANILTKVDVDEKGGTPLSISYVTKKPILYLGTGQEPEDLEEFNKEKMLENLGIK
jgi:fused signal recognition particle receptor